MPPPMNGWTRLEPDARSEALDPGLRAQVHDPLWLLARQWQVGEFWAEDAGSPIQAWLRMDCTPVTRYLPGGVPVTWYQSASAPAAAGQVLARALPLEAVVERERVRPPGLPRPRLAAEAGLHLQRLLADAPLRAAVLSRVPLPAPTPAELLQLDPETTRFLTVIAGRVPDGLLLASVLTVLLTPAALNAFGEPYRTRVSAGLQVWQTWQATLAAVARTRVDSAVTAFVKWYGELISEPADTPPGTSWVADRLEYAVAVSAPTPQGEVVLAAPEYTDGHLEWYSFDVLSAGTLGALRTDLNQADTAREAVRQVVIPTSVRYPGMPASRYWEFEDARVDFGAVAAGPQQLAHLLLVEFALVGGDDWFVIPVDTPVGSLCRVRWLVVTNTFGERTLVRSAREVDAPLVTGQPPRLPWDMFRLSADPRPIAGARALPDALFLPATLATSLHGKVLEEVVLLRDELANMGWAVERVVESPIGRPIDRAEAYFRSRVQPSPPVPAAGSTFMYRLRTAVPEHWLPLYPVRTDGSPAVRLLRGGAPLGRILEPDRGPSSANPLRIYEEEVPREGARVSRAFQYARWMSGSTHVWVGRRKGPGRGEGSSGLHFDVLEPLDRPDQGT